MKILTFNESIRDLMKPKSKEEIFKSIENMSYPQVNRLLWKEVSKGEIDVVEVLIELGVNIHNNDEEALQVAMRFNKPEMTEFLIKQGANFHHREILELMDILPSSNNSVQIVQNLLKTNESVRDLMKPKSEEEIRKSIGEEKYNIYKSLSDAKNSIKLPYKTDNLSFIDMLVDSKQHFEVEIRFLRFTISYDGNLWKVGFGYNKEHIDHYNTWDEVWKDIIEFTNDSFNKEILVLQKEINRYQKNINEMKKLISEVDLNNKSVNESQILRFDDIQNLEFRKGSLEHGDKVKQLIEFLLIYKNQNEDTMVFNKNDFETLSRMKVSEIEQLNNLPTKKSLFDFNIEITDDQIKFTNLQNRKSLHEEIKPNKILRLENFGK